MLIGSTSRMINGGKAIKTIYWRAKSAATDGEKKIYKYERTFHLKTPANIRSEVVSKDSGYEKFCKN